MDDVRAGLQVRAVRLKHGLRQCDLAERAGVSRQTVSRLENGDLDEFTLHTLRKLSRALGMPPIVAVGWRGADVAELLDARHASLVEIAVRVVRQLGWQTIVEYSFSHYGERGSVDIVAWHPATQTLLLIEVKTRIVDLQDLLSTMDRKRRLVPELLRAERGWVASGVGNVLLVPSASAIHDAVARHAATFDSALPSRTVAVKRWLKSPRGDLSGIWFVRDSPGM